MSRALKESKVFATNTAKKLKLNSLNEKKPWRSLKEKIACKHITSTFQRVSLRQIHLSDNANVTTRNANVSLEHIIRYSHLVTKGCENFDNVTDCIKRCRQMVYTFFIEIHSEVALNWWKSKWMSKKLWKGNSGGANRSSQVITRIRFIAF